MLRPLWDLLLSYWCLFSPGHTLSPRFLSLGNTCQVPVTCPPEPTSRSNSPVYPQRGALPHVGDYSTLRECHPGRRAYRSDCPAHTANSNVSSNTWCTRKNLCVPRNWEFRHDTRRLDVIMLKYPLKMRPMTGIWVQSVPVTSIPWGGMNTEQHKHQRYSGCKPRAKNLCSCTNGGVHWHFRMVSCSGNCHWRDASPNSLWSCCWCLQGVQSGFFCR